MTTDASANIFWRLWEGPNTGCFSQYLASWEGASWQIGCGQGRDMGGGARVAS
jgi:hypothetical protein